MITLTETCAMPEEQLTSTQQTALSSLILGNTVSEAAGEAGVHRNTVHRWLKSDESFQQARDQAQQEAQRTVEAKLHDSATAAMECIEECLQQGDAYVAEQLLKGLGCYDGRLKDVGSDEAVTLAQEALRGSEIAEMLGGDRGPRSEFGSRRSAQAEGELPSEVHEHENLHDSATSHQNQSASHPPAPTSDLRSPTSHPQPTAPPDDGYADLTSQQTTAMMALQTGQSIEEAANTGETNPATVYQWLHGDYTFQAAMNRCAEERRRAIHARLQQLATLAADLIDRKIRQGNGRLAVRLLKGLGYLGGAQRKSATGCNTAGDHSIRAANRVQLDHYEYFT